MSKSLGNYVGITESPNAMFGKLLSISDGLMWSYYELLTDLTTAQIAELRGRVERGEQHPKLAKVDLAKRIIADFHSPQEAEAAAAAFDRVHVRHEAPDAVPEVHARKGSEPPPPAPLPAPPAVVEGAEPAAAGASAGAETPTESAAAPVVYETDTLSRILVKCQLASSGSDATRKIRQGAVKIDGARVTEFTWRAPAPGAYLIQVGPRTFVRLVVPE
jgi:tyrosyl-tRNA synthetase